ncbi:DUF305 domain-containing protein [Leptothermofonsia sichuanensis E412]|uniref:DUF305 domain-containing protein n=1 Tax=Leptothermofonsia sichuanensis TaxID=2917832 RepID=UPI001CA6DCCE|nr:DUF305 domain-containing protein [Leptothermofonsia sichuanensis]QZZ20031.1 DUF305 domain-containing protein [Leptothermofonsia sichuanensis E412]
MNSKIVWLLLVLMGAVSLTNGCQTSSRRLSLQDPSGDLAVAQDGHQSGSHSGMNHGSMSLGPKDEFFDLRFIDGMIPHHEGAVLMAQEALQKSSRPEIRTLAKAIINVQQKEIRLLQGWRKDWYPNAGQEPVMWHSDMNHMMPMTREMRSAMMMARDLGLADDQFDRRFIEAMVPHHEGALVMAQAALEKSDRPEIRQMAADILSSQQQEIAQMRQWRNNWYGK